VVSIPYGSATASSVSREVPFEEAKVCILSGVDKTGPARMSCIMSYGETGSYVIARRFEVYDYDHDGTAPDRDGYLEGSIACHLTCFANAE
jgi:hypothetical protein